jgi:enolase
MAVSIACARAGACHKGVPLFRYISEMAHTEPQIPLPVPAVLSRSVGSPNKKQTQTIHIYPTVASSLDSAMETIMQAAYKVNRHLVAANAALTVNSNGCPQTASGSTEEALGVRIATQNMQPTAIISITSLYLFVMMMM